MFINQPYYAILSKNTEKDATVLKVTAVDKDKGNNGEDSGKVWLNMTYSDSLEMEFDDHLHCILGQYGLQGHQRGDQDIGS